jgi:hypothetical protein
MVAVAQRLDGGLDDVLGRLEVGLADAEVDDVAPFGGESRRASEHGEGILLSETVESGDGVEHCGNLSGSYGPVRFL